MDTERSWSVIGRGRLQPCDPVSNNVIHIVFASTKPEAMIRAMSENFQPRNAWPRHVDVWE